MNNIKFAKKAERTGAFWVYNHDPTIYINPNWRFWGIEEMNNDRAFDKFIAAILSHESHHIILDKLIDCKTSTKLDKLFGLSFDWSKDLHGLGDFEHEFKPQRKRIKDWPSRKR